MNREDWEQIVSTVHDSLCREQQLCDTCRAVDFAH